VSALALRAGVFDPVSHYAEAGRDKVRGGGGAQLVSAPTGGVLFIQVQMGSGPLANDTLREAV